jgi:hypothetical protein
MAKKRAAAKSKPKESLKSKRCQESTGLRKERRRATKIATTISRCASGDSDSSKQTSWLLCKEALISPPSSSKSLGEADVSVGFICTSSCPKSPSPASYPKKAPVQEHHKPTSEQRKNISDNSWKSQEQEVEHKNDVLDDSDFNLGKEEDELFHFLLASTFYQPSSSIPSPCVSILTPPDFFCKGVRMIKMLPVSPIQVSKSSELAAATFKDCSTNSIEPDLIDEEKVTYQLLGEDTNRIPLLVSFQLTPKKNAFGHTSLFNSSHRFATFRDQALYAAAAGKSFF